MTGKELNLCAAAVALGLSLLAVPAASASTHAAIGGVRDPAAGVLELTVQATESTGVGLRSANATLGGVTFEGAAFADPDCLPDSSDPDAGCPAVASVGLRVATTAVPDGVHRLQVTITPGAGAPVVVYDEPITVNNTPIVSTPTVTVSIGSGAISEPPPSGSGPPPPAGGTSGCVSPRLSMFLAQSPLRIRRGVPVLAAGRRYRYLGRLTCRVNGRRRSAPQGTRIEVRNRLRGRTFVKPGVKVRKNGLIVTKLAYPSSRVIVFRARAASGELVRVRIPIRVVHVKRGRA